MNSGEGLLAGFFTVLIGCALIGISYNTGYTTGEIEGKRRAGTPAQLKLEAIKTVINQ